MLNHYIETDNNNKTVIAIIDSGVNSILDLNCKVIKKLNITESGVDNIDVYDNHGHGTALAGMLDEYCGNSIELIILKILDSNCRSTSYQLMRAMEIGIELKPDIINMSVGTENLSYKKDVELLCKLAISKGIIITATTNDNTHSLPYMVNGVVRVLSDYKIIEDGCLYVDDNSTIYTIGVPHIVPWKNGEYVFINRNSFVTPYFIREFVNCKSNCSMPKNYAVLSEVKKKCKHIKTIEERRTKIELPNDMDIYNLLRKIIGRKIRNHDEHQILFNQGLNMKGCIDLLKCLEKELCLKIPFTYFSINDFEYISNLSNKLKRIIERNGRSSYV